MFEIGFSEILIVAVIALLVLGPEKLPKAARYAGLWVRRARAQWYSVKAEFEREIAQEELRRSLAEPLSGLATEAGDQMRALADAARAPFAAAAQELRGTDGVQGIGVLRAATAPGAPHAPDGAPDPAPSNDPGAHDPFPGAPQDPTPAPLQDPTPAPLNDPMPAPLHDPTPAPTQDPTPSHPPDAAPPAPRDAAAPPS